MKDESKREKLHRVKHLPLTNVPLIDLMETFFYQKIVVPFSKEAVNVLYVIYIYSPTNKLTNHFRSFPLINAQEFDQFFHLVLYLKRNFLQIIFL